MKKTLLPLLFLFTLFVSFNAQSQEVTMFPGFWDYKYYQDDERITKKELVSLLETNDEALKHWKRSRTFSQLSYVLLAAEVGFLVWQIDRARNDLSTTGPFIGVMASFGVGLTFAILNGSQKRKAVLKYNQGLEKPTAFKILPSKRGLGIVLQF
ncbi:hypothetical protein [Poritiphilus flavus]|uniref:Uncharacterized protein n=1 Tax=Poritiphilus flavus TaxID=2697053 RepID=A0A6L9EFW3_9FLAO|nr:hypothetical protein [Poritiphilus flavus]NAS13553.1 hypothetical protein [Poritiphilus flavus]